MATVDLTRQEFNKNQYTQVINTEFTELGQPTGSQEPVETISVGEFFNNYQEIFFRIPKFGETNSHEYLVKTSGEYIDFTTNDENIQPLIDEITQLRQQNLELNQQLIDLQLQSVQNITGSL
tara:strand:+ start:133 stop:498 length:366 start_codon:yes stop_codon:yes gene_type:complete